MNAQQQAQIDQEVQDKYVARLRARLARPKITVEDARDGMLDCFVSTYHTGVKQGLKGIIGVDASPDQVAQVTSRMFRDRLKKRGISFEAPTIDALNDVKEELDEEFHFSELPVEVSATHDQVCSLLIAKADGLIGHDGDRSIVKSTTQTQAAKAVPKPPPVRPMPAAETPPPPPAFAPPVAPQPSRGTAVTISLRQALASYLDEIRDTAGHAEPADLLARLDRARSLVQSIADFSR